MLEYSRRNSGKIFFELAAQFQLNLIFYWIAIFTQMVITIECARTAAHVKWSFFLCTSALQLKMVIDSKSSRSRLRCLANNRYLCLCSPFALCQLGLINEMKPLYVYAESANIQLDHALASLLLVTPVLIVVYITHISILWWNTNAHLTTITATFLEYDNNVWCACFCDA